MTVSEYRCDACGGVFVKVSSDEEMEKEYKALWPDCLDEPRSVVCDDCFKRGFAAMGGQPNNESIKSLVERFLAAVAKATKTEREQ